MPISGENNPRNFVTKIAKYEKIISIPNSMSVLPELLPILVDLAKQKTAKGQRRRMVAHEHRLSQIHQGS
jgi:hypothetical protein